MQFAHDVPSPGTPEASSLAYSLSNVLVESLPAIVHDWWRKDWLGANALNAVTEELSFAHQEADLGRYAANCPVVGAKPSDYAPRLVAGGDGQVLLAGIRFRNLDLQEPFVEIIGASRPFSSESEVERCMKRVAMNFAVFAPLFVRIEKALLPDDLKGAVPGKMLMAAPSAVMVARARPLPPGMSLRSARVLDIYDWYESAYRRFSLRRPDLVLHVRQESRDDFEAAEECETLFEVLVDERRIGLISAYESQDGPIDGVCINEFMFEEAWLGRSLAVAVQGEFARRIHSVAPRAIHGSIHPDNEPTLAAAEKLGRKAMTQQTWIPLRQSEEVA
jgi:RimJ/RimL family protein N-acetyltransferase